MKLYRSLAVLLPKLKNNAPVKRTMSFFIIMLAFLNMQAQPVDPNAPALPSSPGYYELPLDIISFTVRMNEAGIGLEWSTESEVHINHFILEKSYDNEHFTDIATVFAKGTDKGSSYQFDDRMKGYPTGSIYYRIRIIATGGNIRQSEVRVIRPLQSSREGQLVAFPNPCVKDLSIVFPANWQKMSCIIEVYTPSGLLLFQLQRNHPSPVEHIDLSRLGNGIFLVKAVSREGTLFQKIQKN